MPPLIAPPPARLDWAYFLDVDGTLIEIAATPAAAQVDDALLGLVARLHGACGGALALVSGRTLGDLERRLGSVRIPLAGQHGLERRDASGRRHTHRTSLATHRRALHFLSALAAQHAGLLLEDKGMSLALHYRQAPQLAAWLHRAVRGWLAADGDGLQLQAGRRVLELKPTVADKGAAIGAFMSDPPFCSRRPVFIGDDLTDEHGFARVNDLGGISIKVGRGASGAAFRLADVAAVRRWLAAAINLREVSG